MEYGHAEFESIRRFPDEPGSGFDSIDGEIHALFGQARRSWDLGAVVLAASAGGGALILDAEEFEFIRGARGLAPADVAPPDPQREVEPLAVLGLGVRRRLTKRLSLGAEARDLMHVCNNTSESFTRSSSVFCFGDARLHHLELNAIARFEF